MGLRTLISRIRGETLIEGKRAFVIRNASAAALLTMPKGTGLDRVDPCPKCNRELEEVVITTGGPTGDPDLWDSVPIAVDGWACVTCGHLAYPKTMSAETSVSYGKNGVSAVKASKFRDAEWWFTRIAWSWPDYVPAYLDLATALRARRTARIDTTRETQIQLLRRLQRAYDDAVDAGQRAPDSNPIRARAMAYLGAAELAAEARAADRARRALDGLQKLEGISDEDRARADEIATYVETERWHFSDASAVIAPHMHLQGGRPEPIETPDQRARCARAVEELEAYHAANPTHWQSIWTAAMGRAALGDNDATLQAWRHAFRCHPERPEIAREAALAFLRVDLVAEANAVDREATKHSPEDATLWCNRAVTELLNGNLPEAQHALAESQRLDPNDPIARTLAARFARYTQGASLPRTLRELERG